MARFQIKSFEQEAVVFDTASGDTHLLAPLTAALFRIIKNNPGMTADEMRAALASQRSIGIGPDLADQTDEALASLRRIGLLEAQ